MADYVVDIPDFARDLIMEVGKTFNRCEVCGTSPITAQGCSACIREKYLALCRKMCPHCTDDRGWGSSPCAAHESWYAGTGCNCVVDILDRLKLVSMNNILHTMQVGERWGFQKNGYQWQKWSTFNSFFLRLAFATINPLYLLIYKLFKILCYVDSILWDWYTYPAAHISRSGGSLRIKVPRSDSLTGTLLCHQNNFNLVSATPTPTHHAST